MKSITVLTTILAAVTAAPVVVRDLCQRQSSIDYVQNYNGAVANLYVY
jgi:hypothetical protein